MRSILLGAVLTLATMAGCTGTGLPLDTADPILDLLPAEEPLWVNPQTEPHPAYNFPTLSHPARALNGSILPAHFLPIKAAPLPTPIAGLTHVKDTKAMTVK